MTLPRICVALLLTLCHGSAWAAPPRFEPHKLTVDGDVLGVEAEDLDGDGHLDLLVAYKRGTPPAEVRSLAVFWNRGANLPDRPDLVLPADDSVCAFDLADVDGAPGAELITVGPKGLWARSFRGRAAAAPVVLVAEQTLFYQADRGALPRLRVVQDVAGPRSRDLVVPLLGALGVYRNAAGSYSAAARLDAALSSSIAPGEPASRHTNALCGLTVSLALPAVNVIDTDGDGLADLVLSREDRVLVFRQRAGMQFDHAPTLTRDFATRSAAERKDSFSVVSTSVADLDGDKVADLIVHKQVSHGISSANGTHYVYLGRRGGGGAGFGDKPDQVLRTEGLGGMMIELLDVTGDGRPDLVMPTINVGVWAVVRAITSKTFKVKLRVHLLGADRRFAEKAVSERELAFKISLSGSSNLQAFNARGDYNGDHKPDLAFGQNDHELAIFPGTGGGQLAGDPVEKIEVNAAGELLPVDLDHKGKDDVLLFHPATAGHRSEVTVLFNRGPW